MASFKKYLRLPDKGIEILSENVSQSLRPDSQSLCSVIAPIPWMWMNVFWSMAKSIPVFCLNLNNQFIYDKCSDNGHPREPFIQINGRLPYYKLFLRDVLFIVTLATTKVFENIWILLSENGNFGAIRRRDIPWKPERNWVDSRYCNSSWYLIIRTNMGRWEAIVESGCKRIYSD